MAECRDPLNYPLPDDPARKKPTLGDLDPLGRPVEPYLPSRELTQAVNVAIMLKRPLLIKGEPGCGKTRLARDVAFQLGLLDRFHYYEWFVKSTDRARDGLYTYDAVGRLRDAQLMASKQLDSQVIQSIQENPEYYVHYGPLGRAFLQPDCRCVVLIDEIDKADIDFPNDLLLELDEQVFFIDELNRTPKKAFHDPIVIVTSNDEKDLPDAFLRRCLFHYIEFPGREQLENIVVEHFKKENDSAFKSMLDDLITVFLKLRERMEKGQTTKKVSTSELINWIQVLQHYGDYADLERFYEKLLYPGVLLKSWEDYKLFSDQMKQTLAELKQARLAKIKEAGAGGE